MIKKLDKKTKNEVKPSASSEKRKINHRRRKKWKKRESSRRQLRSRGDRRNGKED